MLVNLIEGLFLLRQVAELLFAQECTCWPAPNFPPFMSRVRRLLTCPAEVYQP